VQPLDRGAGIGHLHELDLPDHRALIGFRDEAAARARDERRVRRRRDDRRLLDDHRDHDLAVVDQEVQPDPERQRERSHGVLDHDVGDVERQRVRRCEHGAIVGRQAERLGQLLSPLFDRHPIERRNPRTTHAPPPPRPTHASADRAPRALARARRRFVNL
jgi:hypothetical protein